MNRKQLCEEYVFLARHLLEASPPTEAILEAVDCLHHAAKLDPACREAWQLLMSAGELAERARRDPKVLRSPRLTHLFKRKRDLDGATRSETLLEVSPQSFRQAEDAAGSDEGHGTPESLRRRLLVLRRLISQSESHSRLREPMDRLAARLRIEDEDAGNDADSESAVDSIDTGLHQLGNDFYKEGDFDSAIACYDMVLILKPDLVETLFNRSLAHCRKANYSAARADMARVNELNPNLAEAWYTAGLIEEYDQEYDAAIRFYQRALEVDPAYHRASKQLETVRRKKRDNESSASSSGSKEDGVVADWHSHMERPACSFDHVGGCRRAKRLLQRVVAFLKGDPALDEWGARPPRGVLLEGRPGVGKTLLARAAAGEVGVPFYAVSAGDMMSMWYGNTEKNLQNLFREAGSHPEGAIIFIDEFDSLGSRRQDLRNPTSDDAHYRTVCCLLALLDGLKESPNRLVVIAATNCVHNIDRAFRRPGRFNYVVSIDAPDVAELAEIWMVHLLLAADRAGRDRSILADELREAAATDCREWSDRFVRRGAADPSGIVELARLSAGKGFTGADVEEVIRRVIESKVMFQIEQESKIDPGRISSDELRQELDDYEPFRGDDDENGHDDERSIP